MTPLVIWDECIEMTPEKMEALTQYMKQRRPIFANRMAVVHTERNDGAWLKLAIRATETKDGQ